MTNNDESFEFEGKIHEAFKVLNAAFEHYSRIKHAPSIIKSYHFDPLRSLDESLQCLRNSINLNRELIFESIRKEHYSELPSRQKSIWLIPNQKESIEFWNKLLNSDNSKTIYKLEILDGMVHRCSQEWLKGGTFSVNHWNMKSKNYWEGVKAGRIDDEVLFEGRFRIIE